MRERRSSGVGRRQFEPRWLVLAIVLAVTHFAANVESDLWGWTIVFGTLAFLILVGTLASRCAAEQGEWLRVGRRLPPGAAVLILGVAIAVLSRTVGDFSLVASLTYGAIPVVPWLLPGLVDGRSDHQPRLCRGLGRPCLDPALAEHLYCAPHLGEVRSLARSPGVG